MSDRALRIAVAVLSLGGAAVATFILAARWRGIELACSTGGCETVQSSSYAELLGVPVALLGLGAYLLIGATALAAGSRGLLAGAGLALGAVLFSAYLLVVQLAVIHAVCDWCLVNDAIVTLVGIAAVLRLRARCSSVRRCRSDREPIRATPRRGHSERAQRGCRDRASA